MNDIETIIPGLPRGSCGVRVVRLTSSGFLNGFVPQASQYYRIGASRLDRAFEEGFEWYGTGPPLPL
jgi:hypothetical protein